MIINFFYLLFLGLWYYTYNFFLSIMDFLIFFKYPKNYIKLLMIKLLIFYEYFLLPPRWITKLEIRKFKIKNEENFTYGETPIFTIYQIITDLSNVLEKVEESKFIDLGCGVGKCVFTVSTILQIHSIGVDNIGTFIKKALKIKKILNFIGIKNMDFTKMDIEDFLRENEFSDNTIFYIVSTAFEMEFFQKIIELIISKVKQGTIITVSKYISKDFRKEIKSKYNKTIFKLFSKEYFFSWGKSKVFVYRFF